MSTAVDGAIYFVASSFVMLKIANICKNNNPVFFRLTRQLSKTTRFAFKPKTSLLKRDSMVLQMLDEHEDDSIDFGAMYVISDPTLPDCPVVYASKGFCAFTQVRLQHTSYPTPHTPQLHLYRHLSLIYHLSLLTSHR